MASLTSKSQTSMYMRMRTSIIALIHKKTVTFCHFKMRLVWRKKWRNGPEHVFLQNDLKRSLQALGRFSIPGFLTCFDFHSVWNCFPIVMSSFADNPEAKNLRPVKHGLKSPRTYNQWLWTIEDFEKTMLSNIIRNFRTAFFAKRFWNYEQR